MGESHVFTITVTPDAPAGVTVTSVSITPTGDTGNKIIAETCDEAGAGTALFCTVTVSSTVVANASIGADVAVRFDDDSSTDFVVVNVSTDGFSPNSDNAVKHWVDASVSITPDGVNKVGESHVFTITVTPSSISGVTVTSVSITPTGDTGLITAEDCDEAGAGTALSCAVTVTSSSVANASIGADVVVTFSDSSSADTEVVSVSTDDIPPNSGPAVKHWVDASVSITPDGVNEIGESHVFTITVTANKPAGVTVTSVSITPTGDTGFIIAETCDEAGAGTALSCTVTVSSNTPDTASIGASVVVTFDDTSSSDTELVSVSTNDVSPNSGPATKDWVDANIQINPPTATNNLGETHTLTVHVNINDGSGFENALAGTRIDVNIVEGPGNLSADFCLTVLTTGTCSVDLTNTDTVGTTIIRASSSNIIVIRLDIVAPKCLHV